MVVLDVDDRGIDRVQSVRRRLHEEPPISAELARPDPCAFAMEIMPCTSRIVFDEVAERLGGSEGVDPQPELLLYVRALPLHLTLVGAQLLQLVVLVPYVQVVSPISLQSNASYIRIMPETGECEVPPTLGVALILGPRVLATWCHRRSSNGSTTLCTPCSVHVNAILMPSAVGTGSGLQSLPHSEQVR